MLIPHSANDAVALFGKKQSFPSVELEAEKNSQSDLQALAFAIMAIKIEGNFTIGDLHAAAEGEIKNLAQFTEREIHSAESLAYVAKKFGYAKTIAKFLKLHTLEFPPDPPTAGAQPKAQVTINKK